MEPERILDAVHREPADPAALLDLAVRIARAAGAELVDRYHRPRDLETKSSGTDPVTDADKASEALIIAMIDGERPDDGMLGEEGASRVGDTGLTWVFDPLDGTVNYLYRLDNFSVSVACEDEHGAVIGVVHDPLVGRTFTAVRGGGAFCDGKPITVNRDVPMAGALLGTGFGYIPERRAAQIAIISALLPRVRDIRRIGSAALDLCAVASGRLDAYWEEGVQRWDVSAGALIAREAGALTSTTRIIDGASGVLAAAPSLAAELSTALHAVSVGTPQEAARPGRT